MPGIVIIIYHYWVNFARWAFHTHKFNKFVHITEQRRFTVAATLYRIVQPQIAPMSSDLILSVPVLQSVANTN